LPLQAFIDKDNQEFQKELDEYGERLKSTTLRDEPPPYDFDPSTPFVADNQNSGVSTTSSKKSPSMPSFHHYEFATSTNSTWANFYQASN
jgi:hypothetical protein